MLTLAVVNIFLCFLDTNLHDVIDDEEMFVCDGKVNLDVFVWF